MIRTAGRRAVPDRTVPDRTRVDCRALYPRRMWCGVVFSCVCSLIVCVRAEHICGSVLACAVRPSGLPGPDGVASATSPTRLGGSDMSVRAVLITSIVMRSL